MGLDPDADGGHQGEYQVNRQKKGPSQMGIKFKDLKNLPVGTHEPCKLEDITYRVPSAEDLAKWPNMKPSYCFRLVQVGGPYDGYSAVRFCNESDSKMSHLFAFVCDLNGGKAPEEFEPSAYKGRWFRIKVRAKANNPEKLYVASADPISAPEVAASQPAMPAAQSTPAPATAETATAPVEVGSEDVPF
jgi:hypothetical protein